MQWRCQEAEFGGKGEGVWGPQVPQQGLGLELRAKPPEAEKNDISFALKITLVNAYRLFISHIMFVTGLSRSSHVSDFQALLYSSPTHPTTCMCSNFSSDLRESQDRVQGRLG